MPKPQEKQKTPQERNKLLDESMQRAYAKVSKEMPDVKPVSVSSKGSSLLTKFFMPRGANAVTNPFTGNVIYSPEHMMDMSDFDKEQIIAHELTHTRQTQNTPWYKILGEIFKGDEKVPEGVGPLMREPYYWRPREMEAFQAERDRATATKQPYYRDPVLGTGDIQLMPERKNGINVGPSSSALSKITTQGAPKPSPTATGIKAPVKKKKQPFTQQLPEMILGSRG